MEKDKVKQEWYEHRASIVKECAIWENLRACGAECVYASKTIHEYPCSECGRSYPDKFELKLKKTRQGEFLKMYPNARLNSKGILDIRPCNIDTSYSTDHCYFACGDECQSNYWLQEVEE